MSDVLIPTLGYRYLISVHELYTQTCVCDKINNFYESILTILGWLHVVRERNVCCLSDFLVFVGLELPCFIFGLLYLLLELPHNTVQHFKSKHCKRHKVNLPAS